MILFIPVFARKNNDNTYWEIRENNFGEIYKSNKIWWSTTNNKFRENKWDVDNFLKRYIVNSKIANFFVISIFKNLK